MFTGTVRDAGGQALPGVNVFHAFTTLPGTARNGKRASTLFVRGAAAGEAKQYLPRLPQRSPIF
ncbi:hypothetical protein ACFQT0_09865 [Hymenobacter humi]|uniref:Carboxypeptidase regulatory-like domain-containing protein n=1 Tax=Hymenobacter humi TaxID=1411620 RepID=A0ABW2U2G8_9BACT